MKKQKDDAKDAGAYMGLLGNLIHGGAYLILRIVAFIMVRMVARMAPIIHPLFKPFSVSWADFSPSQGS